MSEATGTYGYHGRWLRVDLTTGRSEWVAMRPDVLRRFVGGVGMGTYLLCQEAPTGVEPLAPEAPLIFTLSPLAGTPLTTSAKFAVVAKSPLTDRLNDALVSSGFAVDAKRAGFDALVIRGALPTLSVLVIDNGEVRVVDGRDLAGTSAQEAADRLSRQLGADYSIVSIGPAGERLVRFATLSHDGRHAGRGGMGAVMGSKNLKAIAVRGSREVAVADPAGLLAASRDLAERSLGPATAKYRELGTAANLLALNRLSALPTRNFRQGTFDGAEAISAEELALAREPAKRSCRNCTIGCERIYRVGKHGDRAARVEYQSLYALGPLCGIGDPEAVLEACRVCDDLGLDTISTGGTIAFAMECAERGLIDRPGLGFGKTDAMLELIRDVADRRDLGDLLAEGSRIASTRIGRGAERFAMHVKGLEMPGYEPRAMQTMALGLAVSTRGADHNRSGAYQADLSENVDRLRGSSSSAGPAIRTEDQAALMDSLILCKFVRGVFEDFYAETARLLGLVTGWETTGEELATTARRIVTARKLYNLREGWSAEEDVLPARLLNEPLPDGPAAGAVLTEETMQEMVQAYYAARGWMPDGTVPDPVVRELRLGDLGG